MTSSVSIVLFESLKSNVELIRNDIEKLDKSIITVNKRSQGRNKSYTTEYIQSLYDEKKRYIDILDKLLECQMDVGKKMLQLDYQSSAPQKNEKKEENGKSGVSLNAKLDKSGSSCTLNEEISSSNINDENTQVVIQVKEKKQEKKDEKTNRGNKKRNNNVKGRRPRGRMDREETKLKKDSSEPTNELNHEQKKTEESFPSVEVIEVPNKENTTTSDKSSDQKRKTEVLMIKKSPQQTAEKEPELKPKEQQTEIKQELADYIPMIEKSISGKRKNCSNETLNRKNETTENKENIKVEETVTGVVGVAVEAKQKVSQREKETNNASPSVKPTEINKKKGNQRRNQERKDKKEGKIETATTMKTENAVSEDKENKTTPSAPAFSVEVAIIAYYKNSQLVKKEDEYIKNLKYDVIPMNEVIVEKLKQNSFQVIGASKEKTVQSMELFQNKEDVNYLTVNFTSPANVTIIDHIELSIAEYLLKNEFPSNINLNGPKFGDWLAKSASRKVPLVLIQCPGKEASDQDFLKTIRQRNGYSYPCLWSIQAKGRLILKVD